MSCRLDFDMQVESNCMGGIGMVQPDYSTVQLANQMGVMAGFFFKKKDFYGFLLGVFRDWA